MEVEIESSNKDSSAIIKSLLASLINEIPVNGLKDLSKTKEYYYNNNTSNKINIKSPSINYKETVIINDTIKSEILAIKNKKQFKGNLCGFHALFNINNFCKYYLSSDDKEKEYYLSNLNNDIAFYKFHSEMVNYLLSLKNIVPEYLEEDLLEYGPLEKEYVLPIINKHSDFEFIRKNNSIDFMQVFFAGGNIVIHNNKELVDLQNKIEAFKTNSNKQMLIVFLGIINHWTALVITKNYNLNKESLDSPFNYFFLESIGLNPFPFNSENEVSSAIEDFDNSNLQIGIKPMEDFFKKMFCMWMHDTKIILKLFVLLMTTNYDIKEFYIESNLRRFVDFILKGNLKHKTLEDINSLVKFIFDKVHPHVIEKETLVIIEEFNFNVSKIKIYNKKLYDDLHVVFKLNDLLYDNFNKFRNKVEDKNDSHWALLKFFNLIKMLEGYFRSCE